MIEEKYCPLFSMGSGSPVRCLGERCVFYQRADGMEGTCALLEGLLAIQDLSQLAEEIVAAQRVEEGET